ncbi:helix-turn-helix transcriptional regulator [Micromonospora aurantiaca]|uniref:helix-turn-helix domain-containing protein n=1 Tax=Micromonospora aurantiaca (nom. illeg.) TaxID=47850 RepID=UPI0034290BD7
MRQTQADDQAGASKGWGPRLAAVVAGEVRRHRKKQGMSAQRLSDLCAELGWPIPRSVLANLESGYRETITVPELLVLAQALRVPPLRLLVPLGHADTVEVTPGVEVATTDAMRWLRGEAWLLRPPPDGEDPDAVVASFVTHHDTLTRWDWSRHYARQIRRGEMEGTDEDAEDYDRRAERAAEGLANLRRLMRARGLTPPPIPAALAFVDQAATP